MRNKGALIWPGLLLLALDRISKWAWKTADQVLIPGVIALRGAQNTGMALGLFQGGAPVILALSLLALSGCFWLLRRARLSGLAPWGVSLLAGGALGNIIDRVLYGAVTDMFELLFIRFYIFNVADVGVVAGAILCGISLLFRPQDWSKR